MKFGPVPPDDAIGATAVHSIRQGGLVLKKGTKIGPAEAAALKQAGINEVAVARLEEGDIAEDVAAAEIAAAVAGEGARVDRAFTGDQVVMHARRGDVFEMNVLHPFRESLDRHGRIFVDAVLMADVEVEAHRR